MQNIFIGDQKDTNKKGGKMSKKKKPAKKKGKKRRQNREIEGYLIEDGKMKTIYRKTGGLSI